MRMRVTFKKEHGSETVEGRDAREVVERMHKSAFLSEASDDDYMRAVAHRVRVMTDCVVSTDSAESFLRSLQFARVVTIEEED